MTLGLSPSEFELLEEIVIGPLKATGASVYVFGSRARGDHRTYSDVDILFEGGDTDDLVSSLRERIEESMFPYKVDLVGAPHVAASYAEGIERDKVRV